jgi:hypothetical protein
MTSWRLVLRSQVPIYLTVPRREALPKLTPQQIGFAVLAGSYRAAGARPASIPMANML